MREPTDRQLIIDMQRGDRTAMERFFRRYSHYLYAVSLRYVSDTETAKDLLQDAFVRIFTSIGTFKIDNRQDEATQRRSIKSWAARVTANVAINYLRDSAHLVTVPMEYAPAECIPDEDVDVDALSADVLSALIEDLPANYRTVFNLFAVEGFTHREISKMLGISESLSATQYHRAKAALKIKIKNYLESKR